MAWVHVLQLTCAFGLSRGIEAVGVDRLLVIWKKAAAMVNGRMISKITSRVTGERRALELCGRELTDASQRMEGKKEGGGNKLHPTQKPVSSIERSYQDTSIWRVRFRPLRRLRLNPASPAKRQPVIAA